MYGFVQWHPSHGLVATRGAIEGSLLKLAFGAFRHRILAVAAATDLAHLEGIVGRKGVVAPLDGAGPVFLAARSSIVSGGARDLGGKMGGIRAGGDIRVCDMLAVIRAHREKLAPEDREGRLGRGLGQAAPRSGTPPWGLPPSSFGSVTIHWAEFTSSSCFISHP